MKFAATVRRWRRERALTQRAAAKRLGVPYRTFQDWELGNRTPRGIARNMIIILISADGRLTSIYPSRFASTGKTRLLVSPAQESRVAAIHITRPPHLALAAKHKTK